MEDFDKDIENAKNNISGNKNPLGEVNDSAETFENIEKGWQATEKGLDGKGKNNEEEKEADGAEEKAHSFEEKAYSEENKADEPLNSQYSSYYSPPYYVPNFTVVQDAQEKVEKKKKSRVAVLLTVCGILLALIVILCFAVINLWKSLFNGGGSSDLDLGNEKLSVIYNSPKLNITQNTDADYVPKSLPEVVSKVGNSVVEIRTSGTQSSFYGQYVTSGAGSGVIVTQSDEAGYLLTNYHVVYSDSTAEPMDTITVVLTNADEYEATIIGSDSGLDLAVLRIKKKANETFTVAEFGDSSKLVVGQDIIAIGNPLGSLGGTVTDGIISALDRRVEIDGVTMVLLQHNAAINPGNSGGALFDMMGNLVGIVNAKSLESGIEGLGFAIPSNIAFNFLNRVMVLEPALGIKVQYGRLDGVRGLYVVEATNTEFRKYDRITKINGQAIDSAADYYAIIDSVKIGDTVKVTFQRNGVQKEVEIILKN